MGFQVSAGVVVQEIDLTGIVPAVSTTEAAVGGVFRWGPVEDRDLVSSEGELVTRFGKPNSDNFETWFTAANFLAYGNKLWVSRAASSNAYNSLVTSNTADAPSSNVQIKNTTDFLNKTFSNTSIHFYAKYPGTMGNSLKVSQCDSANAFSKVIDLATPEANITFSVGSDVALLQAANAETLADVTDHLKVGDYILAGNSTIGTQYLKISGIAETGANASITFSDRYYLSQNVIMDSSITRYWEYFNYVDGAPTTTTYTSLRGGTSDELHIVVVDEDGQFTGTPGTILEVWQGLSRAQDAKAEQGGSNFYKDVINQGSKYIWSVNPVTGAPNITLASGATAATTDRAYSCSFSGGTDSASESAIALGDMIRAYDQFRSTEDVDVSLILCGKASSTHGTRGMGLVKYIIENICEYRMDCVALASPQLSDVVNNPFQEAESVVLTRQEINSTSYAMFDSGYKLQYDRYNDTTRWVPLNGDIGGLIVRTDDQRDPWWSPAGFNRGFIKNVIKLAYNPDKADRDLLYKSGVNPVVTFPSQGTLLYGDKTLLTKPSAFDRINVRRLFIVLEKAISTAAKYMLFEFNDAFTRARFRNMVEPFLRDVQGRRGIYDFRVVCDETNNPGSVIDRNEFVGDIYIKPARSINFITLHFVAVGTDTNFDEVIGQF